jgi:hypothetical protein
MMAAPDHALRLEFAGPRLAPIPSLPINRAALAAVALALLVHIGVVSAFVILGPGAPPDAPSAPAPLLVAIVTPDAAPEEPAAAIIEPVTAPEPEPRPVEARPVDTRIEPAPAVITPAPRDTPAAAAGAATEAADPADAPAPGSMSVLTAEGGHSDMPHYAAREGSALRGLFCVTGARDLRVAAGCDMLGEGVQGITGYGLNLPPDQLPRGFWLREEGPGSPESTVNAASIALPGQVFSQHSHFSRGAHSALGQLPVPARARDPGFGD